MPVYTFSFDMSGEPSIISATEQTSTGSWKIQLPGHIAVAIVAMIKTYSQRGERLNTMADSLPGTFPSDDHPPAISQPRSPRDDHLQTNAQSRRRLTAASAPGDATTSNDPYVRPVRYPKPRLDYISSLDCKIATFFTTQTAWTLVDCGVLPIGISLPFLGGLIIGRPLPELAWLVYMIPVAVGSFWVFGHLTKKPVGWHNAWRFAYLTCFIAPFVIAVQFLVGKYFL